jgi:hypothetical protein
MWDTPTPPHPNVRLFAGSDRQMSLRLRCIPLNKGVTGITVICGGGDMYGIHAHRDRSSAAPVPPRLQNRLVWLYFPFRSEEEVRAVWLYPDMFTASIIHSYR